MKRDWIETKKEFETNDQGEEKLKKITRENTEIPRKVLGLEPREIVDFTLKFLALGGIVLGIYNYRVMADNLSLMKERYHDELAAEVRRNQDQKKAELTSRIKELEKKEEENDKYRRVQVRLDSQEKREYHALALKSQENKIRQADIESRLFNALIEIDKRKLAELDKERALFQLRVYTGTSRDIETILTMGMTTDEYKEARYRLSTEHHASLFLLNNKVVTQKFETVDHFLNYYHVASVTQTIAESLFEELNTIHKYFANLEYREDGYTTNLNIKEINAALEILESLLIRLNSNLEQIRNINGSSFYFDPLHPDDVSNRYRSQMLEHCDELIVDCESFRQKLAIFKMLWEQQNSYKDKNLKKATTSNGNLVRSEAEGGLQSLKVKIGYLEGQLHDLREHILELNASLNSQMIEASEMLLKNDTTY